MPVAQNSLHELKQEAAVTRRYLASVPFDKKGFKPHEKSESLGRLAIHVAEIIAWWKACLTRHELDFIDFEPENIETTEALLYYFDGLLAEAEQVLRAAKDENFDQNWSMRYGDEILFTLQKEEVAREFCMNHFSHHRAQLGVYLRM